MMLRRGAAWSAMLLGMVLPVLLGSSPAAASNQAVVASNQAVVTSDKTAVAVRMPATFIAGEGPGSGSITVSRKGGGGGDCDEVRRALTVQLRSLALGQVRMQRRLGGGWLELAASSPATGAVRFVEPPPGSDPLCRGQTVTAEYRMAFAASVPGSPARLIAQAFDSDGESLGADATAAEVRPGVQPPPPASPPPATAGPRPTAHAPSAGAPPMPMPTLDVAPTPAASSSVSPAGSSPAAAPEVEVPPVGPPLRTPVEAVSGFRLGTGLMALGLLLIVLGGGLLGVLLVRRASGRSRRKGDPATPVLLRRIAPAGPPPDDGTDIVVLPAPG